LQWTILLALLCGPTGAWCGVTELAVVTGQNAPEMEKYAARELCGYLSNLFGIKVCPTNSILPTAGQMFLVGNPVSNALIATNEFPSVSDQGVVLKSAKLAQCPCLIIGGGSPRAALWAVYLLAEKWGVRYLLHGDNLPSVRKFEFPQWNIVEEPTLKIRQWRVLNEHAMGPISWGMADYRPLLDQLAKLRFNRLLLYIWPGQPFLPLEYKGIRQTSGTLFFGNHYPITDDMIGRSLYGSEKEYWNPDLPLPGNPEKLTRAAIEHVRSLLAYAHQRGMECVMPANLTEFPREFAPLVAHTHPVEMTGTPTIGPGPDADPDDAVLSGLARAVVDTTVKTYPDVDYIALDLPEWREWSARYQRAWTALDKKYGIEAKYPLELALAAASKRTNYPGGAERALTELKADIVALYFYDRIISDPQIKIGGRRFILSSVAEEVFPILAQILPQSTETLNFVDYTPSRVLKRRDVLKAIPARRVPSVLIFTLHDDNVGVLPQLATHSLAELTADLCGQGWLGFSTRYWLTGDHDSCVAYLSQAAWHRNVTPEQVSRDQIKSVCGDAAIEDMQRVFREVEAATFVLEWNGLGFAYTSPQMMRQHWKPGRLTPELESVSTHYQSALDAARAALGKTRPTGKPYVTYWIGRLEFGVDYMATVAAVHRAATAESEHDYAAAIKEAEVALKLSTKSLEAYTRVARDRSDKGAIAVMNEYVFRPIRAKAGELKGKAVK
jgi:hypothetical protein